MDSQTQYFLERNGWLVWEFRISNFSFNKYTLAYTLFNLNLIYLSEYFVLIILKFCVFKHLTKKNKAPRPSIYVDDDPIPIKFLKRTKNTISFKPLKPFAIKLYEKLINLAFIRAGN